MNVLAQVTLGLVCMVAAYALLKWRGLSVELSMFLAAVAGAVVFGAWFPARHVAEGAVAYLDICLILVMATLFMNIVKESGGIDYLVRAIVTRFARQPALTLILLMFLMLLPGALTGAGSVSVLVMGEAVALVLISMGIVRERVAAIVYMLAGLAAVAPPVNLWAMLACAGTAVPYVGFALPSGIPVVLIGLLTVFALGLPGRRAADPGRMIEALPPPPAGMNWLRVALPLAVVTALLVAARTWPFRMPILGLPLVFALAAAAAILVSPKRINVIDVSERTVRHLLPLLGTVVVVGVVMQLMALTGVRGLLSLAVISLPIWLLYVMLPVIIPISEGVLTVGGALVIGAPLVWTFNSVGLHATIVIAGLSLLWMLGDALPPTALIGRLTVKATGYEGSYGRFLKTMWLPAVVTMAAGTLMVVFSRQLAFLVR